MRRLLLAGVVALATGLVTTVALAGNQEVADQIAKTLRDSGQMADYKIGVKFLDGTAWLQGRVQNQDQMNRALKLVFQTPGVVRVVNDLTVGDGSAANPSPAASENGLMGKLGTKMSALNPLRKSDEGAETNRASALSSSFSASRGAVPVAMMQPVPPAAPTPAAPAPVPTPAPRREPAPLPQSPEAPGAMQGVPGAPLPMAAPGVGGGPAPMRADQPSMPGYAWPSYAAYPNYAAVTYPKQYSPTAWPYIGPFYPYPQVPLGWRKVSLEWDDGWWFLDFKDEPRCAWWR